MEIHTKNDTMTVAFIQIMMYKRQPGRAPDNLTNM